MSREGRRQTKGSGPASGLACNASMACEQLMGQTHLSWHVVMLVPACLTRLFCSIRSLCPLLCYPPQRVHPAEPILLDTTRLFIGSNNKEVFGLLQWSASQFPFSLWHLRPYLGHASSWPREENPNGQNY